MFTKLEYLILNQKQIARMPGPPGLQGFSRGCDALLGSNSFLVPRDRFGSAGRINPADMYD